MDAARLVFASEQMRQSIRHRADGHALYAEAAGGHGAGDIGKDLAVNADQAFFRLHSHIGSLPFLKSCKSTFSFS